MLKYAIVVNEETKQCDVGLGTDTTYYESLGMTLQDVEQAYNEQWYLMGYAPEKPAPTYQEQRLMEYPPVNEQLDMLYWDQINGTNLWLDKISTIKEKYPKK